MKIRCEYCDTFISDTDERCPNCGAPNAHLQRSASGVPKTIEELKAFAAAHNLPLFEMRFFLGEDYRGPRAFGIYQDEDGRFIVYKNKANGDRAVRYIGYDEAYAVNELWQKMRTEVQAQKARRSTATRTASPSAPQVTRRKKWYQHPFLIAFAVFVLLGLAMNFLESRSPDMGYYAYDGGYYYYDSDNWYAYDAGTDDWYGADVGYTSPLYTDSDAYYESYAYEDGAAYESFYDSDYYASDYYDSSYDSDSSSDSFWSSSWDDDDWDWDTGDSWDSGSTDWDSDW